MIAKVPLTLCLGLEQSGLGRIKANLGSQVRKGKMTQQAADAVLARVKGTLDYAGFGDVDMVRLLRLERWDRAVQGGVHNAILDERMKHMHTEKLCLRVLPLCRRSTSHRWQTGTCMWCGSAVLVPQHVLVAAASPSNCCPACMHAGGRQVRGTPVLDWPECQVRRLWLPDQVVEAVLEDVGLKQRIFADLEKACRPDCILSSNTSTIDISLIGAKTKAQARIPALLHGGAARHGQKLPAMPAAPPGCMRWNPACCCR